MLEKTKDIIFFKFVFPIISLGSMRYSCPIRLVPTNIQPAKEIRLLEKLQPDSFKTERLDCVETDGQTDGRTWSDSTSEADQEYIYFMGSETSPLLRGNF